MASIPKECGSKRMGHLLLSLKLMKFWLQNSNLPSHDFKGVMPLLDTNSTEETTLVWMPKLKVSQGKPSLQSLVLISA